MKHSILFIEGTQTFINQAIVNRLQQADFDVVRIPDEMEEIAMYRNDAEIMLYYPADTIDHIERTTKYLIELCKEEHKTLCLVGEPHNVAIAEQVDTEHTIYAVYKRPVNMNVLVDDMLQLLDSYQEYSRRKRILIVDDDNDFLTVMKHWLQHTYQVDGIRSGKEALHYLEYIWPDLILLDYEMPELDGYQVLDEIRKNPLTARIPIIFLTGKNDKDSVMRILKRKPDGYLLKSMKKDELIDALDRFFTKNILRGNNS